MDEYGQFRHNKEDAMEVARQLVMDQGTVVFTYALPDNCRAYIILLSTEFKVLGTMGFGGSPRGRMYVGVYGFGCGHLPLDKGPHHMYIEEKLNIESDYVKNFAEFYSWIIDAIYELGAYGKRNV